ncbi:hypothetical protein Taro_025011 [Colocasia esculenta]|uniref:Uncharacterized protein n=1 Tax=Colocasia esculenta TaxID=4460 RepID=A0A843VFB1_COLES|nr:hypothetical protein [Colocasia esculenta]
MFPCRVSLHGYKYLNMSMLFSSRRARLHEGKSFVFVCVCLHKETLSKQGLCPKTYSYVHKIYVHMCVFHGTLPKNMTICSANVRVCVFVRKLCPCGKSAQNTTR